MRTLAVAEAEATVLAARQMYTTQAQKVLSHVFHLPGAAWPVELPICELSWCKARLTAQATGIHAEATILAFMLMAVWPD